MRPEVQNKVNEVVQKWDGFLGKVNARVNEVIAEAEAGIDQLMEQHAQDYGPMGAAFTAIQTRFHGLDRKVDDAYSKVSEEIDELTELDDLTSEEWALISGARDSMSEKCRQMRDHIDLSHYTIEMKKSADWARRLQQIAQEEIARGVPCSQCGAKISIENLTTSTQQKCASCGAVNEVTPGMAAASFYHGNGAHALAQEQVWNLWLAERNAERELKDKRHATAYDQWVYHKAAHDYWTAYYQAGVAVYPGFTKDVAAAVEAKMKHYTAWDQEVDKQKRDLLGKLVEASANGDVNTVNQIVGSLPHFLSLDDCIECLVERKHYPAAKHLFGIKYTQDGEDDPKEQWIARELEEMKRFLAEVRGSAQPFWASARRSRTPSCTGGHQK